jgi:hypothetical protein
MNKLMCVCEQTNNEIPNVLFIIIMLVGFTIGIFYLFRWWFDDEPGRGPKGFF